MAPSPRKSCIFGGAFDPVHLGHIEIACRASAEFGFNRTIWVPTYSASHKAPSAAPFKHRLEMVRLAIRGLKNHEASDIEASLPVPSYTINTLHAVQERFGIDDAWFLLTGADNWSIFRSWHRWEEVLNAATLVIYPRSGHPAAGLPPGALLLDAALQPCKSSDIRSALAAGAAMETTGTANEVQEYIRRNALYR